jgi:hypothetical protein
MRYLVAIVFTAILIYAGMGCAALPGILQALSQGSQYLGAVTDVAEDGAAAYLARHPNQETERAVFDALRKARLARAALDAAIKTAKSVDDGNVELARSAARDAYAALKALLDDLGITAARPPMGGAETNEPKPEPFVLPPADQVL